MKQHGFQLLGKGQVVGKKLPHFHKLQRLNVLDQLGRHWWKAAGAEAVADTTGRDSSDPFKSSNDMTRN